MPHRHIAPLAGALALLLSANSACAQARTEATPASEAQSLACLQRPAEPPTFPPRSDLDRGSPWARVLLRFSTPTAAPEIEILANTLREDQLKVVRRYVDRYRLPCLQPSDGSVQAVQEFNFNNSGLAPLPMPPDRPSIPTACIVQPADGVRIDESTSSRDVEHVVLTLTFFPTRQPSGGSSDASGIPEVKVLYTNASPEAVRATVAWAARSRMPCLTGETDALKGPVVMRQQFTTLPPGYRVYALNNAQLPLTRFLGMVQDLDTLKADFDFDTMNCPFKVNYTIYGPRLPNEVEAGQPVNPNRLSFLKWLEARDLRLKPDKMANDLFGQTIQIDVPCGKLKLGDETTAVASP